MTNSGDVQVDAAPYLCRFDTETRSALRTINDLTFQFLIIVDEDSKPVGTLTDGDIRRGLLDGYALEQPVERYMFRDFKVGYQTASREAARHLRDDVRPVPFVPLLDETGIVRSILVRRDTPNGIESAIVMAGGFGKRLGHLTKDTPKPLVEVNGRPILDHVMTALEDAGIRQIHLTLHYRADQIREFVEARTNRAAISFIEEETPLGTAGSLSLLPNRPSAPFLVVNGDIITDVDYGALNTFFSQEELDGVLCVSQFRQEIPYGVVEIDDHGLFEAIREKPTMTYNVASGIYLLSPAVLNLVEANEIVDMPTILDRARALKYRIGVFPIHEYWIDLGRPTDLDAFRRRGSD